MKKWLGWANVAIVIAILVTTPAWMPVVMKPVVEERSWRAVAANANPGSGQCGIINVLIYPHQSDTSVYDSSLSESNAYAHFDSTPSLNESLEGNVPYNEPFDIVIVAQYNYTVAYNTSSNSWDHNYVRCLITCADLNIGPDDEMLEGEFYGETGTTPGSTVKINFYLNNGGSGYTIAHGETINITSIKLQGYW